MEVLYQKEKKSSQKSGENVPFALWLPWQSGWRNNINYDIKLFAIRFQEKSPNSEENGQKLWEWPTELW